MNRIIESATDPYDKILIKTIIDTGCRIGDIGYNEGHPQDHLALKGKDVFNDHILTYGKTHYRSYRIRPDLARILKAMAGSDDDYVFKATKKPSINGHAQPASANVLSWRVHNVMLKAGLKGNKLYAHTLRHSTASLVMDNTENINIVQSVLQHDKVSSTEIYMHHWKEKLQQKISPLNILEEHNSNTTLVVAQPQLSSQGIQSSHHQPNPNEIIIVQDNNPDTLIESMFPEPQGEIGIRPLIKTEDLALLRRAFIALCQFGQITTDPAQARNFYNRILRRA